VKQGETIGALADKYQTTVAVLREVNGLRSNTLHAGQTLLIPAAKMGASGYALSADARVAHTQSVARNGQRREHEVQPGETLWSISRDYGVDMRTLASWNAMAPGDVLSVGRELVVWTKEPATVAQGSASASSAVRADATPATSRPDLAPAAARLGSAQGDVGALRSEQVRQVTYVVRRGDSLYSIARRFRVSVAALREWNGVAAEQVLHPGQRLKMLVDVTEQSG
jgi:membrane-bound lytic murein transglycosylase D